MQTLFEKVYHFYQNNFSSLGEKKFHFASRLYLWNGDEFYKTKLMAMEKNFLGNNFLLREYTKRDEALAKFDSTRLHHLQKFPDLLPWHDILIQGLYAETIFKKNVRKEVKKMIPIEKLLDMESKLFADSQALAWLSTYATSFLYFIHRYYLSNETTLNLTKLYDIGLKSFDPSNLYELNLQIYYFTHCIIGETLFYSKIIPNKHHDYYLQIIKTVENLIANNYKKTHIDHKLEFLMCCLICSYQSKLTEKIFDEVNKSVSNRGNFLVDKFNIYNDKRGNFGPYEAEHQNVLFLMSKQKPLIKLF